MSVEKNSSKRNEKLSLTKNYNGDNLVQVDLNNCEELVGEKGTIIVHDTNSSHRANEVFENNERNIIRAHSWQT